VYGKEERERQREVRWEAIRRSKYNRWYKEIKRESVPGYLKKGWGEERWSRIARFRLGNEVEERKHWEEGEKKLQAVRKRRDGDMGTHLEGAQRMEGRRG